MFGDKFSKAAAWIAIAAGVLALIIRVIGGIAGSSDHLLLRLLLGLIGLLCAGLGAERLGPIEKIFDATKNIGRLRWIDTGTEVYQVAKNPVSESPDPCEIKATDLYPNREKLESREFASFNKALAERIQRAIKTKAGVNGPCRMVTVGPGAE